MTLPLVTTDGQRQILSTLPYTCRVLSRCYTCHASAENDIVRSWLPKELNVKAGRHEVADVFRAWQAAEKFVRVEAVFRRYSFCLVAKVQSVDETTLRLKSDDTHSELALCLTDDLEYGYADNRMVLEEEKRYENAVVIFYEPPPASGLEFERIALAASSEP